MDRRAFIGSLALGTLAVPRVTSAQPARKVYQIGVLGLGVTADMVGSQPRGPANKRRAAVFVDKTIKGAKAADLPVEQPTVINVKTVKTLGITILQVVLLRADQVIQ